jgi:hypothetical protein
MYDHLRSLGQIVATLPPRSTCDKLLTAFIEIIYPMIPILHLPTFYHQYEDFWLAAEQCWQTGVPSGIMAEHPSFLPCLLACLFCGSLQTHLGRPKPDQNAHAYIESETRQSESLYRNTMQSLVMLGFPRDPTFYSLAAYVIWHIPLIREESERSTAFISTAFRVGQTLGLHKDPKHFDLPNYEAECRRRLWWHILNKDACM